VSCLPTRKRRGDGKETYHVARDVHIVDSSTLGVDLLAGDQRPANPQQWMHREGTLPAWVMQHATKYKSTIEKLNDTTAEKCKLD
jgi:hypothetical protein